MFFSISGLIMIALGRIGNQKSEKQEVKDYGKQTG